MPDLFRKLGNEACFGFLEHCILHDYIFTRHPAMDFKQVSLAITLFMI